MNTFCNMFGLLINIVILLCVHRAKEWTDPRNKILLFLFEKVNARVDFLMDCHRQFYLELNWQVV